VLVDADKGFAGEAGAATATRRKRRGGEQGGLHEIVPSMAPRPYRLNGAARKGFRRACRDDRPCAMTISLADIQAAAARLKGQAVARR
jgi:hypothetical protein